MIARKLYFLIAFLFCLAFSGTSFSQEEANHSDFYHYINDDSASEGKETENFQAKFINMLIILGLLIGMMIVASWTLKRMMRTRVAQMNTASEIKIQESRHLSPRATIHLIDVQGEQLLIAESPTSVTLLAKMKDHSER
jgi:flagellar biogenesis protein FliO